MEPGSFDDGFQSTPATVLVARRARLALALALAGPVALVSVPAVANAALPVQTDLDRHLYLPFSGKNSRPVEQKKGADQGIDGRLYFHDSADGDTKQVILSVKAGKVQSSFVRDLVGVLEREKAQIGVLISFNEPTGPMREKAASAGHYQSPWGLHQKIQLLTVGELLDGRRIDMPPAQANVTTARAPRVRSGPSETQRPLEIGGAQ